MRENIPVINSTETKTFILKIAIITVLLLIVSLFLIIAADAEPISDAKISMAVDTQLQHDVNIPAHLISTSTENGVVTLSGVVDNLLAKERSQKIAETVKGVRSVLNLINVMPYPKRSDEDIKNDIIMRLVNDPTSVAYEIKVEVNNGIVTLSGKVDSYQEGVLAGLIAKGVNGVVALQNNITFVSKEDRPDWEIKAEITDRLKWDVWVNQDAFQVEVKEGKVSLTGTARSIEEMNRASFLAWVGGVKSVDTTGVEVDWDKGNALVREEMPVIQDDHKIKKAIKTAFSYDPRLATNNIDVIVEKGFVTLTGPANSLLEKNAAENDAEDTVGVLRVKNLIKVRPPNKVADKEIVKSVRDAFAVNPYVTEDQVRVTVLQGRVFLSGTVESFFEKNKAGELASRQKGVVAVDNNITVYMGLPYSEDWEILQDIKSELWWSPFVDEKKIEVSVKDGIAYLSGEVDDINERDAAAKNAFEGGAKEVINYLKVKDNPYY